LVLNYLSTKGIPLTSANVREAVTAANANPGLIPGLVTDRPATDAEDRAAMSASRQTRKGGGNNRRQRNASEDTFFPSGVPNPQTADKNDTFFPGGVPGQGAGDIDAGIYGWLIPAILGSGLGAAALKRMFGGPQGNAANITPQSTDEAISGASEYAGRVEPGFKGRTIDVNPAGVTADQRKGIVFQEDQPSTTTKAIDRAVGEDTFLPEGSAAKQIEGGGTKAPSGRTSSTIDDTFDITAPPRMPPGVTPADTFNAATRGADTFFPEGTPANPMPRPALTSPEPRSGLVPPNLEDLLKQIFRLGIK